MSLFNGLLAERLNIVWAAEPKNYTGAAMTALWVNLKLYNHCTVVIQTGAWAGGTAAVTLRQATSNAGAGAKALSFNNFPFYLLKTIASDVGVNTAVVSDTFNIGTPANQMFIIEVEAEQMDLANNFNFFSLAIASPGANNDFYGVTYLLGQARNAQRVLQTALS